MYKIFFFLCLFAINPAFATDNAKALQDKAVVCSACHGADGKSNNASWPNLAGQHAPYLIKQLNDFKQAKTRDNPVMSPILAQLNQDDIVALAAFYAAKPRAHGQTSPRYQQRGEQLYRHGDFTKHITACIACHGPHGTGNAQAGFPSLAGQQVDYTRQQLQAFHDKKRTNDPNHIMQDITARMSPEDMIAIAHYLAGL